MRHLGPPPREPRPELQTLLAADYARRAGIAAGYREAAGITDPHQVILGRPQGQPRAGGNAARRDRRVADPR